MISLQNVRGWPGVKHLAFLTDRTFLSRYAAAPLVSEVVQGAGAFLQHGREKFVIP